MAVNHTVEGSIPSRDDFFPQLQARLFFSSPIFFVLRLGVSSHTRMNYLLAGGVGVLALIALVCISILSFLLLSLMTHAIASGLRTSFFPSALQVVCVCVSSFTLPCISSPFSLFAPSLSNEQIPSKFTLCIVCVCLCRRDCACVMGDIQTQCVFWSQINRAELASLWSGMRALVRVRVSCHLGLGRSDVAGCKHSQVTETRL